MKTNYWLFALTGLFFAIVCVLYAWWGYIYYHGQIEWGGTVALGLTAIMGWLIGFYLWRTHKAQGGDLPEDRIDGNIDDGDPEIGNFAPWSWWPFIVGVACAIMFLGLAVGFWICFIGGVILMVAVVGWVFEFYRGNHAR